MQDGAQALFEETFDHHVQQEDNYLEHHTLVKQHGKKTSNLRILLCRCTCVSSFGSISKMVSFDLEDCCGKLCRNASTCRNTFAMVLHALDPGHGSGLADGMGYSTWRDHSVVDLGRNSPHDHLHHDAIG